MGKLSLDALIQRDVPERHRTSAFARSETLLQLSWVIGGFIGIAIPLKLGDNVSPSSAWACWPCLMVGVDRVRAPPTAQPGSGDAGRLLNG